ncbi:MAG: hypothetical protein PHE33_11660 [Bacteroidales bacterium]|nr:hypothetical protein [Bacteroidales bacterium]
MKLKINRTGLLLSGFVIIIVFFFLNRINDINKSEFSSGIVIGVKEWSNKMFPEDFEEAPIVQFFYNNQEIIFVAQRNVKYENGEKVKVIFKQSSPDTAKIYSFVGYWLVPIILCLVPLILFSALVLTFIGKLDFMVFSFKGFKLYKNPDKKNALSKRSK